MSLSRKSRCVALINCAAATHWLRTMATMDAFAIDDARFSAGVEAQRGKIGGEIGMHHIAGRNADGDNGNAGHAARPSCMA